MKIGIIGGGLMGMALARELSSQGHAVTVFEREKQLGGLSTHKDYGPFYWDRFYHVVLPTDRFLIRFLGNLSSTLKPRWIKTLTGFYVDRQMYSLSSSLEFLKFSPLSLLGKVRLAMTILYCARINDWKRLEQVSVADWLRKISGQATYEKIWKPLLLAKLGENYKRVSAVFIWSYIKRMFSARENAGKNEQLGYIPGGYRAVFSRLEASVSAAGGNICTGIVVNSITESADGGLLLCHDQEPCGEHFNKVIFTSPVSVLRHIASDSLIKIEKDGRQVEYLGVICMVLVTSKPLVPYYVVNIADSRVPFTGIIGMSNLVAGEETADRHLTFLPRYVHSEDPLLLAPDEELREQFLQGLGLMLPECDLGDIESMHIHRAKKVQPLQVLNYSSLVPKVKTEHPDFYILNTSQFVNNTLNNNEVIRFVEEFLQKHGAEFHQSSEQKESTEATPLRQAADTVTVQ